MNVAPRNFADAAVLSVQGRLDQDTCVAFTSILMKSVDAAAAAGGAVVLDLSRLEYISSAGLRCFMLASRQAKAQHAKIAVAALQPMVSEIFQISHFNLVFQVFPTVREALGALSDSAAAVFDKG
jgi:anti-anti-sigma factor